jgi:hypothetical protein
VASIDEIFVVGGLAARREQAQVANENKAKARMEMGLRIRISVEGKRAKGLEPTTANLEGRWPNHPKTADFPRKYSAFYGSVQRGRPTAMVMMTMVRRGTGRSCFESVLLKRQMRLVPGEVNWLKAVSVVVMIRC